MATWIKTNNPKEQYIMTKANRMVFTPSEVKAIIGSDFEIITLLSDDLLLIRDDCKDYDILRPNKLASFLAKEPIYGDALIVSPEEFD